MTTKISSNRMLVVFAPVIMSMFLKVTTEDDTQSRHYIYGHLSFKGIDALIKKDMVKGMHSLKELDETCFDFLMGKPHRKYILKHTLWTIEIKLNLVRLDVCGPIKPTSNGGNMYFITFTYYFSWKTWIYFMHEKYSAFNVFKKFNALVGKESGHHIKCFRTNIWGEFTSTTFFDFCSLCCIKRKLTTAYAPQ